MSDQQETVSPTRGWRKDKEIPDLRGRVVWQYAILTVTPRGSAWEILALLKSPPVEVRDVGLRIAQAGLEGWELVSAMAVPNGPTQLFFKRPRVQD